MTQAEKADDFEEVFLPGKKYGFTVQTLPVLIHGVQSVQGMKPAIDLDDVETWNAARSIAHNVMADRESQTGSYCLMFE